MFELGWVELLPKHPSIGVGIVVAVLVRHFGFWSLNASRIVYTIEEQGDVEKFGFAYGTLPGHVECGEERFTVEYHHSDGAVWYDLFAFSKPSHILAKAGYPISRMLQKQFARDSLKAMKRAMSK